jgi:hypothetical protein
MQIPVVVDQFYSKRVDMTQLSLSNAPKASARRSSSITESKAQPSFLLDDGVKPLRKVDGLLPKTNLRGVSVEASFF